MSSAEPVQQQAVMSMDPSYLPPQLADELFAGLPDNLDEDVRWYVHRLAEAAYRAGYRDAYPRGWREGAIHQDRLLGKTRTGSSVRTEHGSADALDPAWRA